MTPKQTRRHVGKMDAAHRKGTCRYPGCGPHLKAGKRAGNARQRTQAKYRACAMELDAVS